jgi:hypothetical protein
MIIRCGQIESKLKSRGDPLFGSAQSSEPVELPGCPYNFILNRDNYFTLYPEDRHQLRF